MPDFPENQTHAPDGWIDLHTHILPAMDDGARDLEQALEMARMAEADGIACLVATPHCGAGQPNVNGSSIRRATEQLNQAIQDAGLYLTILPGAEVQIDPDLCEQVKREQAITLADSRYLLLELPAGDYPIYTEEIIFRLQLMGLSIIIAHPERNLRIQERPDLLTPLIERGVLTQLTAASIVGAFGSRPQRTAEYLLQRNMAHVIASDAHGGRFRRPMLSEAVEAAGEIVGLEHAEDMACATPWAIINDEVLEIDLPKALDVEKKRFWTRLWQTR